MFDWRATKLLWLLIAMACCSLTLVWPSTSNARSVDRVTLTPAVTVQPVGGAHGAAPGGLAPSGFAISNQGSSLAIAGEFDFTAPLLNTSLIRGWWMVVERRTGSGSWTAVAGSSAAAAGYAFAVSPPMTSGMSIVASPKAVLGVSYPTGGDRVVGTQIPGLFRANWNYEADIPLNASATNALMTAAASGEVRLRWRLESRNTGLFGIVTSGSSSNTAPFKQMLNSQSSTANNVATTVTGDGRTQSFTPANTSGLSSIPVGATVEVASTASIPSVPTRSASESVEQYLDRLEAAKNQSITLDAATSFTASGSALAYWWWPWDTDSPFDVSPNRSVSAPGGTNTAGALIPIMLIAKTGPSSVNAGSVADYEIAINNVGNTSGDVTVVDTVDGYEPQTVPGYGSVLAGATVSRGHSHSVSITAPSGTLSNTALATWTDSAGNNYGPVEDVATATVVGDEDPPPPPTLTQVPPTFTNVPVSNFEFVGEPGGGYECSLDGGPASSCGSPFVTGSLDDGQHQFAVSQRDAAGNLGSAMTYVWTVDTTAPAAVVISEVPTGTVASPEATVVFSSELQAIVECRINAADWSACSSPASFSGLADGEVRLEIRQTDLAGNPSEIAQAVWIVDTTPPAAPILTATPPSESTSSEAVFEFTIEPGSAAECSLDGAEFSACASPATYNSLEEGTHAFAVRAVDAVGNTGGASAYTWNVTFEINQCRPEVTESTPLEIPDEAGMEDAGGAG